MFCAPADVKQRHAPTHNRRENVKFDFINMDKYFRNFLKSTDYN